MAPHASHSLRAWREAEFAQGVIVSTCRIQVQRTPCSRPSTHSLKPKPQGSGSRFRVEGLASESRPPCPKAVSYRSLLGCSAPFRWTRGFGDARVLPLGFIGIGGSGD